MPPQYGNGNPTTYSSATFGFDPENRLTSISSPAFTAAYDGDGLRVWKGGASGANKTYFLYDGDHPLLELDSSGNVKAANGFGADGLRSRYYPTSGGHTDLRSYHYTYDPQGNLIQRLRLTPFASYYAGGSGTGYYVDVLDTAIYDAYGKRYADLDTGTGVAETYADPAGFGGQYGNYTDPETGLVLMTHRYYDAYNGRFLTRDPIGYKGGINLYGYTGNNPVMGSDPEGTMWSGYKWIYTGDGNAPDEVYDAAVDQGAATLTFEYNTMLNLNKDTALAVGASAGLGTWPMWQTPKTASEMRSGSRPYTSNIRRISEKLTSKARKINYTDSKASKWLRKSTVNEATHLKKLLKGNIRGSMPRGASISRVGAAKAALRYGGVGVLYYEAGLSIYTGNLAMQQPLEGIDVPSYTILPR